MLLLSADWVPLWSVSVYADSVPLRSALVSAELVPLSSVLASDWVPVFESIPQLQNLCVCVFVLCARVSVIKIKITLTMCTLPTNFTDASPHSCVSSIKCCIVHHSLEAHPFSNFRSNI